MQQLVQLVMADASIEGRKGDYWDEEVLHIVKDETVTYDTDTLQNGTTFEQRDGNQLLVDRVLKIGHP